MFTAGVVFVVLAGIQMFIIALRSISLAAAKFLVSDRVKAIQPDEDTSDLEAKIAEVENYPVGTAMICALVCVALAAVFFYFQ